MAAVDSRVLVRAAEAADAASLGEFILSAWKSAGADAPGFAGATDQNIAELAERRTIGTIIGDPDAAVWLAITDEEVVGFAATRTLDNSTLELAGVIVDPAQTGRGVGKALVRHAIDAHGRTRVAQIIVRTEPTNARAIGFYQSLGFEERRTVTERVGDRELRLLELALVDVDRKQIPDGFDETGQQ